MIISHPQVQIHFGGKGCDLEFLKLHYPEKKWMRIKQTHSDIVRLASEDCDPSGLEGDALITKDPAFGLAVSTADCQPVMVYQPQSGWIGAIHAGWKGVANRITVKTLAEIKKQTRDGAFQVWIGPHIQAASFEVGTDVKEEILASLQDQQHRKECVVSEVGDKAFLNLSQVVVHQIQEAGFQITELWISPEDTKTSQSYHSHRRDRDKAGRQLSAVLLR